MRLSKADIPFENLFAIGINSQVTTRDAIVIAHPRSPFVVNRGEALNIVAYMITQADLTTQQIEQAVNFWNATAGDWFFMRGDESRVTFSLPRTVRGPIHMRDTLLAARKAGIWALSIDESVTLLASLIRTMSLHPSEIDAAVMAGWEQPRGQETEEDIAKRIAKDVSRN